MNRINSEDLLNQVPDLQKTALAVSQGIHDWVLANGNATRRVADLLHGTWLGHPLHPVLTDLTLGAWILGSVFDLLGSGKNSRRSRDAADTLIALGTISAVPTALAGITDYSTIPQGVASTGAAHGLINTAALLSFGLSSLNRRKGNRGAGKFFSSMGLGLVTISAWLGGELTYRHRVGVNHVEEPEEQQKWAAVLDKDQLVEGKPRQVKVNKQPVLLYRKDGEVVAIGAVCAHEGGPLEKGEFDGWCVECPWHQSVYDMRDGSVVHGPSTYSVPAYDVRVREGKIEVRLRNGAQGQPAE